MSINIFQINVTTHIGKDYEIKAHIIKNASMPRGVSLCFYDHNTTNHKTYKTHFINMFVTDTTYFKCIRVKSNFSHSQSFTFFFHQYGKITVITLRC